MYARALDLAALLRRRSLLLLGPRQTGKSTLLASQLPAAVRVDLLRADQYRQFSARPELLREVAREALRQPQPMLVVDEVQKIPALLDEAHALIAAHPELRLVLTGSSARKLRRAGTNLLGGRAARATLHPIVHPERGSDPAHPCDLARAMALGGLPAVLLRRAGRGRRQRRRRQELSPLAAPATALSRRQRTPPGHSGGSRQRSPDSWATRSR